MPFLGFLPSALRLLVLTSLATSPSLAAITNRTIDDTNGDSITSQRVIYRPNSGGIWNNMVCPLCAIRPDPVQAFSGTWTEATYFKQTKDPISATFSFTGKFSSLFLDSFLIVRINLQVQRYMFTLLLPIMLDLVSPQKLQRTSH